MISEQVGAIGDQIPALPVHRYQEKETFGSGNPIQNEEAVKVCPTVRVPDRNVLSVNCGGEATCCVEEV